MLIITAVTGDPFSVVTLTRPGNACPVIVNFSMKLYNRNTCEICFCFNILEKWGVTSYILIICDFSILGNRIKEIC